MRCVAAHYDGPIRRLLDELVALGDTFKDNEAAQVLQQDVSHLVRTVVYDEQGQPKVKLELVQDLEVLLSAFLRKVRTGRAFWAGEEEKRRAGPDDPLTNHTKHGRTGPIRARAAGRRHHPGL